MIHSSQLLYYKHAIATANMSLLFDDTGVKTRAATRREEKTYHQPKSKSKVTKKSSLGDVLRRLLQAPKPQQQQVPEVPPGVFEENDKSPIDVSEEMDIDEFPIDSDLQEVDDFPHTVSIPVRNDPDMNLMELRIPAGLNFNGQLILEKVNEEMTSHYKVPFERIEFYEEIKPNLLHELPAPSDWTWIELSGCYFILKNNLLLVVKPTFDPEEYQESKLTM